MFDSKKAQGLAGSYKGAQVVGLLGGRVNFGPGSRGGGKNGSGDESR